MHTRIATALADGGAEQASDALIADLKSKLEGTSRARHGARFDQPTAGSGPTSGEDFVPGGHDSRISEELGGMPLAGYETHGEIALAAGNMSGFHDKTTVVLAFPK